VNSTVKHVPQTSNVTASGLFHTGIVVPDITASMDEMGAVLGITWRPVAERLMTMAFGDGEFEVLMRYSYSENGPHHLELIEGVPGTIWDASTGPRLHHIGYGVTDLDRAIEDVERLGVAFLGGNAPGPDAPRGFAYHASSNSPLIELVNDEVRRRVTGS